MRVAEPFALTIVLALAACGGKDRPAQSSTPAMAGDDPRAAAAVNPCANPCGDPCAHEAGGAGQPAEVPVPEWSSWNKLNDARFFSKSHGESWVDVHVPAEFASAYLEEGAAPVGMKIVKAQHPSQEGGDPNALTVMVKMQEGYDPDGNDWFYGVYDPAGTTAKQQGKIALCKDCHAKAGSDYLFRRLE